jgi:mitochondrial fission protein ELM1
MHGGTPSRSHPTAHQRAAPDAGPCPTAPAAAAPPCAAADPTAPRTWLILGDKAGDNAQIRIVADALGWPFVVKDLVFRAPYVMGKPHFRASLYHVDRARSAPLEPPWPDLILTVGRRPSMAALWVKAQAQGRARLVVIGRPKRWLERFDLVIAPPQFQLPSRPNVLRLDLPLMRIDEAAVAAAAEAWRARLADLPRPLVALLVGGPTKPYVFDAAVARRLIDQCRQIAGAEGGSLYVTSSRRTPPAVVEALAAALPAGARLYRWDAGGDNPYQALLGLADRFVVTGDSVSMMVEVARLGRPLAIFALPAGGRWLRLRSALGERLAALGGAPAGPHAALADMLYRLRIAKYARDLSEIHRRLYARGLAVPLGEPFQPPRAPPSDDLAEAVGRVRALMCRPAE